MSTATQVNVDAFRSETREWLEANFIAKIKRYGLRG